MHAFFSRGVVESPASPTSSALDIELAVLGSMSSLLATEIRLHCLRLPGAIGRLSRAFTRQRAEARPSANQQPPRSNAGWARPSEERPSAVRPTAAERPRESASRFNSQSFLVR